ncbi:CPBP family intramembrane glutamic endopeptidase [Rhodovulum sp. DZ06]|uniref:CPBP family intramembrane glutamic endopeptidase n=1 Tax=Rhodovulum sp. DZ06 TaxID=3425126 RepID=UPI003D332C79
MTRFRHPLNDFSAPARGSAEIWRTVLGVIIVIALGVGMGTVMRQGMDVLLYGLRPSGGAEALRGTLTESARPSSELSFLLMLATFACNWPALWIVLRVLHRRPFHTLWGPLGRINWKHYRIGLAVSLTLGAAAWLPWLHYTNVTGITVMPLENWLLLLCAALPLLFVQTAAEELMFRGYMLQQFAARSWSILGWSVAPSLLFAFLHPSEGMPLGLNWLSLVFGLVMAAVTSRTANLGAAAGLHFGHNVINTLIISTSMGRSEPVLLSLPPDISAKPPLLIFVTLMFLGSIIYMGQMDLKFIMAWRADPTRKGQPPIRLVLPIDEKWIQLRERRAAAKARRRAARERLRAQRAERSRKA